MMFISGLSFFPENKKLQIINKFDVFRIQAGPVE